MRRVTVVNHREGESWWAESPDLPGFSAAADSSDELDEMVRDGVDFYLDGEPHALLITRDDPSNRTRIMPTMGRTLGATQGAVTSARFAFEPTRRASARTSTNPKVVML